MRRLLNFFTIFYPWIFVSLLCSLCLWYRQRLCRVPTSDMAPSSSCFWLIGSCYSSNLGYNVIISQIIKVENKRTIGNCSFMRNMKKNCEKGKNYTCRELHGTAQKGTLPLIKNWRGERWVKLISFNGPQDLALNLENPIVSHQHHFWWWWLWQWILLGSWAEDCMMWSKYKPQI